MLKQDHTIEENIKSVSIKEWKQNDIFNKEDQLALEEPLAIQLCQTGSRDVKSVAITMRTPGDDADLAVGFLFSEGIISDLSIIHHIAHPAENTVRIFTNEKINIDSVDRNFYMSSSCGVCGKASLESLHTKSTFDLKGADFKVDPKVILSLKKGITSEQSLFTMTGGIHAAALFDLEGKLESLMEDVGRHNALDKLIGHAFRKEMIPLSNKILLLSGRASFELIQKATMAGIACIVSVGAPSSLAYDLASENGQTLIGFVKDHRFNVYTGSERMDESK